MVSIKRKGEWQSEWETIEGSKEKIQSFTTQWKNKLKLLVHDLHIADNLLTIANRHRHTDVYSKLTVEAQKYSDRHVVERIRRLVYECICHSAAKHGNLDNIKKIIEWFSDSDSLSEPELTLSIVNSINSTGDFRNFCNRFSWIGQMDYALGFFESISSRALERINDELKNLPDPGANTPIEDKIDYCFRTKWIRDKFSGNLGSDSDASEYLNKLQSKLFLENFIITLVNIFDHLLFRENDVNGIKNIEFHETRDRLTNEKKDAIISLNGPYRTKKSIQLILQTVFIY